MTWEWNYGESLPFNFKNSKRFDGGKVEVLLNVKDGIVSGCKIFGDFLGVRDISYVEQLIKGKKYTQADIQDALGSVDIKTYFGNIGQDELVSCFFA
ncbi:MAG: Lipoate-protein ligase A [Firmicutes bacterium]|nr:Lipoate-protein ligase A [Bacillota bacterium]MDI6705930.1 lipoate protein ligase C-terminal domain-containing protein [Bacillota bacterium]